MNIAEPLVQLIWMNKRNRNIKGTKVSEKGMYYDLWVYPFKTEDAERRYITDALTSMNEKNNRTSRHSHFNNLKKGSQKKSKILTTAA